MRVLVALDKFKDSLGAAEACRIVAEAVAAVQPLADVDVVPLADGGDGFARTLTETSQGRWEAANVTGPRGQSVRALVGFVSIAAVRPAAKVRLALPPLADDAEIAVLDFATASGLALLSPLRRDPWHTTSRGTGHLLRFAAARGAQAIVLGLGGSATNDLALGALVELGWRALDAEGRTLGLATPAMWPAIVRLEPPPAADTLPPLRLACDVANPLLGPQGATAVFGPQKGLAADDIPRLEEAVARMAGLLCAARGSELAATSAHPGAGAAGGAGFGLMVGAGAPIVSGAQLVEDWLDLATRVAEADVVITGEGRFDATSLGGKGPGALLATAARAGKRVHLFAGRVGELPPGTLPDGATLHALSPPELPLPQALAETATRLDAAVRAALG